MVFNHPLNSDVPSQVALTQDPIQKGNLTNNSKNTSLKQTRNLKNSKCKKHSFHPVREIGFNQTEENFELINPEFTRTDRTNE